MKTIGLVSRCDREDVLEFAMQILDQLKSKASVLIDTKTAAELNLHGTPIRDMRKKGALFMVSIGGDGTVLRAMQKMDDPLPVLGINMGTIGFLVDVMPDEAFDVIDRSLEGFEVEERTRLAVELNNEKIPPATNEVVILTSHPAKMLSYRIYVDGRELDELRADGAVIATPTGSTAYAMSAGGPMIDPRVDATVIVPLAPFKLSARPWVVPADSTIEVEFLTPKKESVVVIDGQYTVTVKEDVRVTIKKASTPARFVKVKSNGFYERVRSKLVR